MQRSKRVGRTAPRTPGRTSLRALARRLKVSEKAVRKAVKAGRLPSVALDEHGRPHVTDTTVAVQEWKVNRAKPGPTNGDTPHGRPGTLTEAQTRVAFQREVKLELENLKARGLLIDAAQEKRRDFECARTVRDSILNVPDRLSAELAAETDARKVHARLDEELRKALVALAAALDAGTADGGDDASE